jgi:hypothetical protein
VTFNLTYHLAYCKPWTGLWIGLRTGLWTGLWPWQKSGVVLYDGNLWDVLCLIEASYCIYTWTDSSTGKGEEYTLNSQLDQSSWQLNMMIDFQLLWPSTWFIIWYIVSALRVRKLPSEWGTCPQSEEPAPRVRNLPSEWGTCPQSEEPALRVRNLPSE